MPSVLIIDDEDLVRTFLREVLAQAGFDVLEAQGGEEGFSLYAQQPTDLVIADLFMGEQHGLETILRLTQQHPDAKVIAISGGGEYGDADTFLKFAQSVGAKEALPKPIGADALLESVRRVMER